MRSTYATIVSFHQSVPILPQHQVFRKFIKLTGPCAPPPIGLIDSKVETRLTPSVADGNKGVQWLTSFGSNSHTSRYRPSFSFRLSLERLWRHTRWVTARTLSPRNTTVFISASCTIFFHLPPRCFAIHPVEYVAHSYKLRLENHS